MRRIAAFTLLLPAVVCLLSLLPARAQVIGGMAQLPEGSFRSASGTDPFGRQWQYAQLFSGGDAPAGYWTLSAYRYTTLRALAFQTYSASATGFPARYWSLNITSDDVAQYQQLGFISKQFNDASGLRSFFSAVRLNSGSLFVVIVFTDGINIFDTRSGLYSSQFEQYFNAALQTID